MACSNQQASQLGMRSSSVNVYAQQMSNTQLCETLYYNRATNQTKVAIGAEFNRRGLNKKWCDKECRFDAVRERHADRTDLESPLLRCKHWDEGA